MTQLTRVAFWAVLPQQHRLFIGNPLDGSNLVPQTGGSLKVQRFRGGVHLLFQVVHRRDPAAADILHRFVDDLLIVRL